MSLMLLVVVAVLTCRVIATGDINTAKVDDILNTRLNVYSPLGHMNFLLFANSFCTGYNFLC